ncbi:hypothetical protein CTI14_15490 [Methylobacterium radiotolerans]|nr:hypothetical protein CTI14_15490 [Methylobacterium radiotolerans]
MKIVIQESRPYQGGDGRLSPGRYEGTWNGYNWIPAGDTLPLNVIMPRRNFPDPAFRGEVKVFITVNFDDPALAKTAVLTYKDAQWAETSAGIFDLSVNPQPIGWVPTATLTDLINGTTAARDSAQAAAASVTQATTSLTAERAPCSRRWPIPRRDRPRTTRRPRRPWHSCRRRAACTTWAGRRRP